MKGLVRVSGVKRYYGMNIRCARGMRDETGFNLKIRQGVSSCGRAVAMRHGYDEVCTPLLERVELFERSLGADAEVVSHELFVLAGGKGRGGGGKDDDVLALRPEGTASALRALVEGAHDKRLPVRWFYDGLMFRRERPQRGRWRQFQQFGLELYTQPALATCVAADLELITLARQALDEILQGLKVPLALHVNSLGDGESRKLYSQRLRDYCETYRTSLSPESAARLDRGSVLRILDSKDERDRAVLVGAPAMSESLTRESREFRDAVLSGLQDLGIPYVANEHLVRGLEYYQHTVFEFVAESAHLGASQATVLAGGRYDPLVLQFRSTPLGAAGWAMGVDRVALLLSAAAASEQSKEPLVIVATTLPHGEIWRAVALLSLCSSSSSGNNNRSVELLCGSNWGKLTQRANERCASVVIFYGPDEVANGIHTVRHMATGDQVTTRTPAELRATLESMVRLH